MTYSSMSQCESKQFVFPVCLNKARSLLHARSRGKVGQRCERRAEGNSQSFDEQSKEHELVDHSYVT